MRVPCLILVAALAGCQSGRLVREADASLGRSADLLIAVESSGGDKLVVHLADAHGRRREWHVESVDLRCGDETMSVHADAGDQTMLPMTLAVGLGDREVRARHDPRAALRVSGRCNGPTETVETDLGDCFWRP